MCLYAAVSGVAAAALVGAGCLAASGAAAWFRWRWRQAALTELAVTDIRLRAHRNHLVYLKQLRRRMRRDRDPRSSRIVRGLLRIYERLRTSESDSERDATRTLREIHDQARALYQSCLRLVERTLELWEGARRMATDVSRQQLLNSRGEMLDQVEASIGHLQRSLDELQGTALRRQEDLTSDHARLRQELDQGLEVARRVEERMGELERELRIAE
jgi:hypothetical protein